MTITKSVLNVVRDEEMGDIRIEEQVSNQKIKMEMYQ
jgi:hypothetical protein